MVFFGGIDAPTKAEPGFLAFLYPVDRVPDPALQSDERVGRFAPSRVRR